MSPVGATWSGTPSAVLPTTVMAAPTSVYSPAWFDVEHDNLRTALATALATDPTVALEVTTAHLAVLDESRAHRRRSASLHLLRPARF